MCITNSQIHLPEMECRSSALELALASGEQLDDQRLLEVILARHLNETDARRMSRVLLGKFGRLGKVLRSDLGSLLRVKGLTLNAAMALIHIRQITRAVNLAEIRNRILLDDQSGIIEYCQTLLKEADREEFHALFLNKRGELLSDDCLQRGTIDHVSVYPRELLRLAIRHDASFIILVHNHPSGNALPSRADINMTREISRLVNAIGAKILDHIIVSSDGAYSFRTEHVCLENAGNCSKPPAFLRMPCD